VELDPAVIEQARQMDLLTYLKSYEPSNLVRVSGNVYCTKEHDSLKILLISNGKWYWWSRGFGVSALDYLIKVKEVDFVEAVEIITGRIADCKPPPFLLWKHHQSRCCYCPKTRAMKGSQKITFSGVALTISSLQSALPRELSMKVPTITMLFLSAGMRTASPNMPPAAAP